MPVDAGRVGCPLVGGEVLALEGAPADAAVLIEHVHVRAVDDLFEEVIKLSGALLVGGVARPVGAEDV